MKNKRTYAALLAFAMLIGLMAGCGDSSAGNSQASAELPTAPVDSPTPAPTPTPEPEVESPSLEDYQYYNKNYTADFIYYTSDITDLKKDAPAQQGTIESLEYETPAYAVNAVLGTDYTITKKVNIYLPYGYDESQVYNILYLMHGGGDDEDFWLTEVSERTHGKTTRNVVDHMIEDGLCEPVIIVTPTFYSDVEGVEVTNDQCADLIAELGEENYTAITDLYTWYFQYELHDHIIPAVEAKYATYAKGDTSPENLAATRDHRAYAGLSMGSITSMHSILMGNLDYISYVGSFSGAKTDVELFKGAIEEKFADYPVHFWFNGEGTDDIAFEEHYKFYYDALEKMPDKFTDAENAAMVVLDGGAHNYAAWIADLYNALLVFFQQ